VATQSKEVYAGGSGSETAARPRQHMRESKRWERTTLGQSQVSAAIHSYALGPRCPRSEFPNRCVREHVFLSIHLWIVYRIIVLHAENWATDNKRFWLVSHVGIWDYIEPRIMRRGTGSSFWNRKVLDEAC